MIRIPTRDQRPGEAPQILASSLPISLKPCLRFRFPLSWRESWPRCSTKKHEQYFGFYGGLMLVCAFSPSCGDAVCPLWRLCIGWFRQTFVGPYSQRFCTFSFEILISSHLRSGYWMMTDVTNVQNAYQMVIRICVWAPPLDLLLPLWLVSWSIRKWPWSLSMWPSFLAAVLSIIMKIVYPFLQKYLQLMTISTTAFRKTLIYASGEVLRVKEADETVTQKGFTLDL